MLYLREEFQQAWNDKDPFVQIEQLDGEVFRQLEARKTLQFAFQGESYFIKIHRGVGWYEILDNLLRLRKPILGASNEYEAIRKLEQLDIQTMTCAAYGCTGSNPAKQHSFIITEDLVNTISLEDLCRDWPDNPPSFRLKQALLKRIAQTSRLLHTNGVNHRDYYICHYLLRCPDGVDNIDPNNFDLYLIDLHRSQIRGHTPKRWILKDIAGLYFSAMDIGLTKRDLLRFVRIYTGLPLREALFQYQWLWQPISRKAEKLYIRLQRKLAEGTQV